MNTKKNTKKNNAGSVNATKKANTAKKVTTTIMPGADQYFEAYIPLSAHDELLGYMEYYGKVNKPDALQRIITGQTGEEIMNVTPVPLKRGEFTVLVTTNIPADYATLIEQAAKMHGCLPQDIVAGLIVDADPAHQGQISLGEKLRIERWRGLIANDVARYDERGVDIPSAWFEEVEGRPMSDVITDYLCKSRGIGVKHPSLAARMNHEQDDAFEKENVRTRNGHEQRDVVRVAVMYHLDRRNFALTDEETHELIRRFYHKGDCGIGNAIIRAVGSALAWERDAEANAAK